jgi:hypothetical protein
MTLQTGNRGYIYIPGVGTYFSKVGDDGASTLGLGSGAGGDNRIDWAIEQFDDHIKTHLPRANNPENLIRSISISVFGFSRRAALARAFVNRFLKNRCAIEEESCRLAKGSFSVRLRFMGHHSSRCGSTTKVGASKTPSRISAYRGKSRGNSASTTSIKGRSERNAAGLPKIECVHGNTRKITLPKNMIKVLMNRIIQTLAVSALSIIASVCASHAAENIEPQAGRYENTILGFNEKSGQVTGFFSDRSENDSMPSVSCEFYFEGTVAEAAVRVKVYQPMLSDQPSEGLLKFERKGKERYLTIQLEEEQPGCMNIYPKAELAKSRLELTSPENWIEIRMAAEKVFFYKDSSINTKTKLYITAGDVVGVLEYKDEWVKVAYVGARKTTVGWVQSAGFFPTKKSKKEDGA